MACFPPASYSEDLTCPICLAIFNEPVILHCGHSFCRDCITLSLSSQQQCPQCRTTVPTDRPDLTTDHILKSLAEKAKDTERMKRELGTEAAGWLCPEHEEKLKLFCITDQQLACIICRDGEKHEGHKFKPVKEAAASVRKELETFVQQVSDDNLVVEKIANSQKEEMIKTKEKSQQLMSQISSQFDEMHQFLRKREDEIKNELQLKEKAELEKMQENLNAVETLLSEGREVDQQVRSVLEVSDPEIFLKNWTEENSVKTAKSLFKARGSGVKAVTSSLSLMPYESHLQFFMWKEMLQVIQPKAEQLTLTSQSSASFSSVSADRRSLLPACQQSHVQQSSCEYCGRYVDRVYNYSCQYCGRSISRQKKPYKHEPSAFSTNQFTSGQHYWEIDVGQKSYWEVGIQNHFLKYDGSTYTVSDRGQHTAVAFKGRPTKIGTYLNGSAGELSFYDADTMKHIHTMTPRNMSGQESVYLNTGNKQDNVPMTVCWY